MTDRNAEGVGCRKLKLIVTERALMCCIPKKCISFVVYIYK